MISLYVTSAFLALAPEPDDFVEPPVFEIGGLPSCSSDRDCPPGSPLCDTNTGECVDCLGPEHCEEGWACGPTGTCFDACEVDADCEGIDGRSWCDPETGSCVQCRDVADCPEAQYCSNQVCLDDVCIPGETFCFAGALMLCLEDGSAMHVETCEAGCLEDDDGMPACAPPLGSTGEPGGSSDGSPTTGESTTSPVAEGSSGTGAPAEEPLGGRGCACRAAPASSAWGWLLVLVAAGRRRRAPAASR